MAPAHQRSRDARSAGRAGVRPFRVHHLRLERPVRHLGLRRSRWRGLGPRAVLRRRRGHALGRPGPAAPSLHVHRAGLEPAARLPQPRREPLPEHGPRIWRRAGLRGSRARPHHAWRAGQPQLDVLRDRRREPRRQPQGHQVLLRPVRSERGGAGWRELPLQAGRRQAAHPLRREDHGHDLHALGPGHEAALPHHRGGHRSSPFDPIRRRAGSGLTTTAAPCTAPSVGGFFILWYNFSENK